MPVVRLVSSPSASGGRQPWIFTSSRQFSLRRPLHLDFTSQPTTCYRTATIIALITVATFVYNVFPSFRITQVSLRSFSNRGPAISHVPLERPDRRKTEGELDLTKEILCYYRGEHGPGDALGKLTGQSQSCRQPFEIATLALFQSSATPTTHISLTFPRRAAGAFDMAYPQPTPVRPLPGAFINTPAVTRAMAQPDDPVRRRLFCPNTRANPQGGRSSPYQSPR